MSNNRKMQLYPPENWPDFEDLCWSLWKTIWQDDTAEKNGRNGQPQHGVDIFGRPSKGRSWAGIQCKGKDCYSNMTLTNAEIASEVAKARGFNPRLSEYAIATTAPRDATLQEYVRVLSDENAQADWSSITVYGWQDIVDRIFEYVPPIAKQMYSQIFGGELTAVAGQLLKYLVQQRENPSSTNEPSTFRREGDVEPASGENEDLPRTVQNRDLHSPDISAENMRAAIDAIYSVQQELAYQARASGASSSDASQEDAIMEAVNRLRGRKPPESDHPHEC